MDIALAIDKIDLRNLFKIFRLWLNRLKIKKRSKIGSALYILASASNLKLKKVLETTYLLESTTDFLVKIGICKIQIR